MYEGTYSAKLAKLKDNSVCHYLVAQRAFEAVEKIYNSDKSLFNRLCENPHLSVDFENQILTEDQKEILALSKKKAFKLKDLFFSNASNPEYKLTSPFLKPVKDKMGEAADAARTGIEYIGPDPDYSTLRF